jgi:hypothetical protein
VQSRQFGVRQAPGGPLSRPNGPAYATTAAAAAAASAQGPPPPPSQSGPGFNSDSQTPDPQVSVEEPTGFGPSSGFEGSVEQPTGFGPAPAFGEQRTGFPSSDGAGDRASEPLDLAVEALWRMEQERLEAGRRLDEARRQKVEEQKRKKEEDERAEAERRRRAEEALLQKTKLGGGKKAPRRRRKVGGSAGAQGWQVDGGSEFGSSEWGGGAGDVAPLDANEWEDVPDEEMVNETEYEEREREAERLREEERQREERKQHKEEEQGSEFDISTILAEIAVRSRGCFGLADLRLGVALLLGSMFRVDTADRILV